jgi:AraC-like DNA-binding protein
MVLSAQSILLQIPLPEPGVDARIGSMSQLRVTSLVATREINGCRVVCDGRDPARPCEQHVDSAALWLVTAGAFEVRDAAGAHVLDPTHVVLMPARRGYTIRHPAGPDTCISFRGPLIDRLAGAEARQLPLAPAAVARMNAELAAWRRGEGDELAFGEVLATIASAAAPERGERTNDRALSDAIRHELRLHFAEPTTLGDMADHTGYSIFHACRVFRATTGHTIHGFRRELRLRQALARILDGDEPLTAIASAAGFANQSHLTKLFRARFGVTPAKARTREGMRQLSAAA